MPKLLFTLEDKSSVEVKVTNLGWVEDRYVTQFELTTVITSTFPGHYKNDENCTAPDERLSQDLSAIEDTILRIHALPIVDQQLIEDSNDGP